MSTCERSTQSDAGVRPCGVAIVLNNYLHDLATGSWLAANAFQWGVLRTVRGGRGGVDPAAAAGVSAVRTVGRVSLAWIIGGGIVRAAAFRRYEWSDAAGRRQLGLLGAKHVLLFAAVAAGRKLERDLSAERRGAQLNEGG